MRMYAALVLIFVFMGLPSLARAEEAPVPAVMSGRDWMDLNKIQVEADLVARTPQPTFTGFVEAQLLVDGQARPVPIMDMGFQRNFSKYGLGLSGFLLVQDGWAQAYIGPTYKPADWVQIGLSVGAEMGLDYKLKARYAGSVWFGYDLFSFLGCVEFNNESFKGDTLGVWYDLLLKLTPKEWMSLGWRARRFVGLGLYLEFIAPIPQAPLTIWAAYMPFDPEKGSGKYWHASRLLLGSAFNF